MKHWSRLEILLTISIAITSVMIVIKLAKIL